VRGGGGESKRKGEARVEEEEEEEGEKGGGGTALSFRIRSWGCASADRAGDDCPARAIGFLCVRARGRASKKR
jgi:hypothetical protein